MKNASVTLTFLLLSASAWALTPAATSTEEVPQIVQPAPTLPFEVTASPKTSTPLFPIGGNLPGMTPKPVFMSCSAQSQYRCPLPGGGSEPAAACTGTYNCSANDYYVVCDDEYAFCSCWFNFGNPGCACDCYRSGGTAGQCYRDCS